MGTAVGSGQLRSPTGHAHVVVNNVNSCPLYHFCVRSECFYTNGVRREQLIDGLDGVAGRIYALYLRLSLRGGRPAVPFIPSPSLQPPLFPLLVRASHIVFVKFAIRNVFVQVHQYAAGTQLLFKSIAVLSK